MRNLIFYAGISLPLQQPKADLCAGINEGIMKKMYYYFRRVRMDLKVILAVAIASYFCIELWFNNYPELFSGAGKVGEFFSRLCVAYVSGFIFYFIVVHIKTERDKENVNEFVGHQVYQIITAAHLMVQPLMEKFDKTSRFRYLETAELNKLLQSIDRTAEEAPYIIKGRNANWIEWYEYLKASSESHVRLILARYPHLDSKLIKILTRIENSVFFTQFDRLYDFSYDKSFGIYQLQIGMYLSHVRDLEEYANKNLKKHQYLTGEFMGKTRF